MSSSAICDAIAPSAEKQPVACPYYAMLDTQEFKCIGTHESIGDAMDVEPGNSVWTFSHEGLLAFVDSAYKALDKQQPKSPVERILVLSTAHISAKTASWIRNTSESLIATDDEDVSSVYFTRWSEYGWIFSVGPDAARAVQMRAPELAALFAYCFEHHIGHLRLDADGDTMAGFPVFEW